MHNKKILIICVNYNSYNELLDYLESIDKANSHPKKTALIDIFIADNTTANNKLIDTSIYKNINVMNKPFQENLGYLGGVNRIIKEIGFSYLKMYDYFIISNVDLLVSKDIFKNLLYNNYDPQIGWITPRIISLHTKFDKNPRMIVRPSLFRMKLMLFFYSYPVLFSLYQKLIHPFVRKKKTSKTRNIIYAGHGSFMIFTKSFFKKIDNIQFDSFLFGEEMFFAELIRQANMKVFYDESLLINDYEHVSTKSIKGKLSIKMNRDSIKMLIKKFWKE